MNGVILTRHAGSGYRFNALKRLKMPRFPTALVAVFLLAGCNNEKIPESPRSAQAGKTAVALAGDSHCVGLAQATGLRSAARVGASTYQVVAQLKQIPEGFVVVLCAGTNDAPAKLNGFRAAVDSVLAEAERRKQRLIWVGPINSPLWWDTYSQKADKYLALRIPNYVTMRRNWNAGEHDGVFHLTSKGRARLWAIVKEKL